VSKRRGKKKGGARQGGAEWAAAERGGAERGGAERGAAETSGTPSLMSVAADTRCACTALSPKRCPAKTGDEYTCKLCDGITQGSLQVRCGNPNTCVCESTACVVGDRRFKKGQTLRLDVCTPQPCPTEDACEERQCQTVGCNRDTGFCTYGTDTGAPCPEGICCDDGSCQASCDDSSAAAPVCDETSCGEGKVCCDDGTCCDGCCGGDGTCGPCLVFATSTMRNGAFGGLDGADSYCQVLARAGGLPGTYRAWLSDDTGSPSTRFRCTAAGCSGQGYQLLDQAQTQIATDWTDLTDGTLIRAINVTESGGTVPTDPASGARAWSNTAVAGTVRTDVPDADLACVNWTFNGSTPSPGVFGGTGATPATDATWTAEGSSPCGVARRLYCFQQE
jgi:hypothetical protein